MEIYRDTVIAAIDGMIAAAGGAIEKISGVAVVQALELQGICFARVTLSREQSIAANQVLIPAMMPGDNSVLETNDGAGDVFENVGPAVVFPRYTAPKDPRVQQLLKDKEAERDALRPVERTIFTDPRLDPNYRAPKAPKPKE